MKTLQIGGMQEIRSLRNRVGRALGKQEISKTSHDRLWSLLDDLEEEIAHPTQEEAPCQLQESSQLAHSGSELDSTS